MSNERFGEPTHPYRLETLSELGSFIIGPDGRCTCTVTDNCPLRKTGTQDRCTIRELKSCNSEAQSRRAWQSGGDESDY